MKHLPVKRENRKIKMYIGTLWNFKKSSKQIYREGPNLGTRLSCQPLLRDVTAMMYERYERRGRGRQASWPRKTVINTPNPCLVGKINSWPLIPTQCLFFNYQ